MENKELKKKRTRNVLVIGFVCCIMGFLLGFFMSDVSSKEVQTKIPGKAGTRSHGYGTYINFEYEIVRDIPWGAFVVIKNKQTGETSVSGLQTF